MTGDAIRFLVLGIVLAVAGAGLYLKYEDTRPCTHPITFAIGDVDVRFGLQKSTLQADAKAAAAIWNTAEGKSVLSYDPKAPLKISLIYDEREASAQLGSKIAAQQTVADDARSMLDASQAQYTAAQSAYNKNVSDVNARGGATRSEAATLAEERNALNGLADSINSRVALFNASIKAVNAEVALFNQTAGHTFEEGEYVRDSSGERISIFEFVGNTQLERVLAHEFGHAIGLVHNDDPKSIMYAQNESGNLVPTAADLAALKRVCGT